jgi:C-terminal processing protease CtpA/Prc
MEPPTIKFPRWDPGLACLLDDRGKPVVYYVDQGGPANEAGLRVGMTVVSINGRAAEGLIEETMAQTRRYWGYSSQRYLRYQAARWFVRQMQEGAPTQIVTEDVDGTEQTFALNATMGVRYLPRRPVNLVGIRDSANVDWTRLEGNLGLIYVRRIRGDLIDQLDKAVAELKDADGMIIDVRGNSGGGFDFHRAHLNFTDDRSREPDRPRFAGPMALLIDSRCISAGEGWASWFIANKRARVFGTATAGASSRKTTYELTNRLFKVTFPVKAYRGYLDRVIERRGLEPDEEVRPNARDLADGKDSVLEAAVAWLESDRESAR